MDIKTVKIIGNGYLVNSNMTVPKDDGNRHYQAVTEWLKTNTPDPEFSDVEIFNSARADKYADIDTKVSAAILAGFTSAAIGVIHFYPADRDSQANLIGVVATGAAMGFPCRDGVGAWGRRAHTATQLKQVLADGALRKQALLTQADILRAAVKSAANKVALDAIVVSFA